MGILKNKAVAIAITCLIILLTTLMGAHASLTELKAGAQATFTFKDVESILDNAYNLRTLLSRYLDEGEMSGYQTALSALEKASTPGEMAKAADEVLSIGEGLAEAARVDFSQRDEGYYVEIRANIISYIRILKGSDYNAAASEYNALLTRFPTHILSTLTGVGPIDLYE